MSTAPAAEFRAVALIVGPWLIGGAQDLVLQGVLSCQFANYYSWYGDDKRVFKIIVGVLTVGTWLKSIQTFAVIWIKFVVHFNDFEGAMLLSFTAWWESGNALMIAAIGLYWYVAAPIEFLAIFGFLSMAVATHFVATLDIVRIPPWLAAHAGSVFVADICLTLTTAYFLIKSRKDLLPQSAGLVNALLRLTFQTAAPATFCAMTYLIVSQIMIPTGVPTPSNIITLFNMPLPKLYAVSMMWTLNARRTLRAQSSHHGMSGTRSNELSGGRSGPRAGQNLPGDVELSRIHVLAQTHTEQHIDVRDMFDPTMQKGDRASTHSIVK
ncbi:hypothetical protein C8R44DRAFT_885890 [Mycena epipterygia]|nr:hypothetical protein C8R44DRAFT_885890 [Mycena epipterygia]